MLKRGGVIIFLVTWFGCVLDRRRGRSISRGQGLNQCFIGCLGLWSSV